MDLKAIRIALANAARNVVALPGEPGLNAYHYAPTSVTEPCFFPDVVSIDYMNSSNQDSLNEIQIDCVLVAGLSDDGVAQDRLSVYMQPSGDGSVIEALTADQTLNGLCDYVHVVQAEGFGITRFGNDQFLAATLVLSIGGSRG